MNGTPKKPRRSNIAASGSGAVRSSGQSLSVQKTVADEDISPEIAPVVMEEKVPEPSGGGGSADMPELTAVDLVPVEEEAKSGEPAEHSEIVAQDTPAIEVVISEAVIETEERVEQKGKEIMADVIETTKKYTDEAKERFQAAFEEFSEKAKAGVEKSSKAFEELNELAKGNVEALVESSKIASKGVEALGQDAAEYSRLTFEKASAALKSLAAVKSPTEFFQLQSELVSSSFDAFAKETAKSSEALFKLAGDVTQPLSTRVSLVTEKVRSLAA